MNTKQLLLKETTKWPFGSHLQCRKTQKVPDHPPPSPQQGTEWMEDLQGGARVPVTSLADVKKTRDIFKDLQIYPWRS